MYLKVDPFGYLVFGEIIGSTWLGLVETILRYGSLDDDEGRKRLCLQNIRARALIQEFPDPLIEKYGDKKNVEEIINFTFNKEEIYDFDVRPSFKSGSESYYARIKNWDMINFVVKRLTEIPESKKAVMSFIRKKDYQRVLEKPKDDYLPCITTIQFRLVKINKEKGWHMNTIFNARSIDAFQKACGNFAAIVLLSKEVAKKIEKNLKTPILLGSLDGMITDAHIYEESLKDAKKVIESYKQLEINKK